MEYKNILISKEDDIAVVSINRPQALNALNTQTLKEIDHAMGALEDDAAVKVIIITGSGDKAFVAGADISEMSQLGPLEASEFGAAGINAFKKIEKNKKPVIAAVNGFALGGGTELAISCDIRIASERAKFGQPEVGLGVMPGFGATQRLPRLVGLGKAKELIFTGDRIDANEALRIGLVQKVVPQEKLMEEAKAMAKKIAANGQIAVRLSKSAMNASVNTDIMTGFSLENRSFAMCFSTEEQKEGMKAFLEKRKPVFKGK